MKKTKSKIAVLLSVVSMSFFFSCDFRHKEEVAPVDEDNTCIVTWQNADGTILDQEVYEIGDYPSFKHNDPHIDDKSGDSFRFEGWDPDIDQVSDNTTYTARYEKIEGSKFAYRLDPSGEFYRLIKFTPNENETTVRIESTYNDKPVKVIDNYALRGCKNIRSISLPYGLEEICDYAFQNTSISSITIPNTVKTIGTNIFKDCRSLTKVTFPSGIEKIPERTFYNCDALTSISIPSTVKEIGAKAFYNCGYLQTVTIPDSVDTISNKAFYQCEKLSNVSLNPASSSLNKIGEYAFSETGITSFTLTNYITSIYEYSFANCNKLQSFSIPDFVTEEIDIKESAFEGCSNLTTFNAPNNNVSNVEKRAFRHCKSLTSFTFGENTNIVNDSVFQNCQSLINLNFTNPNALSRIGEKSFYNTAITSIKIPQNVNYIGDKAFANCQDLKHVIFPGENISFSSGGINSVFSNCPKYTSNYVDPGKTDLTKSNFNTTSAKALTNISVPNNINSISADALSNCTNLIYNDYPTTSSEGYVCHYLGNSSNPYVALVKVDINSSGATVKIHPDCKVVTDSAFKNISTSYNVEINGFIRNLGNSTFASSAIKDITFTRDASLAEIKSNVFNNSQLESITLPNDIGQVPSLAFKGCANLTSINIAEDNISSYRLFSNKLLVKDESLILAIKNFDFNGKELDLTIKEIDSYSFSDRYKLSYLYLPGSIETVKEYAFNGCTTITKTYFGIGNELSQLKKLEQNAFNNLPADTTTKKEIRFGNSLANWLNVEIGGSYAVPNSFGGTVYYFKNEENSSFSSFSQSEVLISTTKIYPYALAGSQGVDRISFSAANLKEIGEYAFYGSSIKGFLFLRQSEYESAFIKLEKVGQYAFYGCSELIHFTKYNVFETTIQSASSFLYLKEIGGRAFANCPSLTTVFYLQTIQKMAPYAFQGATNVIAMYIEVNKNTIFGETNGISFTGFSSLVDLFVFFTNINYRLTINSGCFSSVSSQVKIKAACAVLRNEEFSFAIDNNKAPSDFLITNNNSAKAVIYYYSHVSPPNFDAYPNYWGINENGNVVEYVKPATGR